MIFRATLVCSSWNKEGQTGVMTPDSSGTRGNRWVIDSVCHEISHHYQFTNETASQLLRHKILLINHSFRLMYITRLTEVFFVYTSGKNLRNDLNPAPFTYKIFTSSLTQTNVWHRPQANLKLKEVTPSFVASKPKMHLGDRELRHGLFETVFLSFLKRK